MNGLGVCLTLPNHGSRKAIDAPYVVERWTKVKGSELSIYYVLSTWNPYVVILMKSRLHVE
jgi:hypothetical protein